MFVYEHYSNIQYQGGNTKISKKTALGKKQLEMLERRKLMLESNQRGVPYTKWVKEIAEKYNVSERTIRGDWTNRDTWLPQIVSTDSIQKLFLELLAELKSVREEYWTIAKTAANENARVGALNSLKEIIFRQVGLLQSIGLVHKEPDRIETVGQYQMALKITLEELMRMAPDQFDDTREKVRVALEEWK